MGPLGLAVGSWYPSSSRTMLSSPRYACKLAAVRLFDVCADVGVGTRGLCHGTLPCRKGDPHMRGCSVARTAVIDGALLMELCRGGI